jgi:predicted transcriptional regulator
MSNRPKAVSCRPHPEINEKLEELADQRRTTKARLLEGWIKEKVEEEIDEEGNKTSEGRETLPEGVYVPDSHKYDYAVAWHENGKTSRKYYKTLEGAEKRARRVRRGDKTLARS